MSNCSHCGLVAEESLSLRHRTCNHMTHADCLVEPINYKLCTQCVSGTSKTGAPIAAAPPAGAAGAAAEPHTTDGRNYILNPGKKATESTLKALGSWLSKQPVENIKTSANPEFLLNNKVPLETIMRQNKLGLDHFLKAGIVLDDFLKNNYSWEDLQKFEYLQKGGKRALQTLCIGLKANANHFRDYPDLFPAKDVQKHIGFENSDYCKSFGLAFAENGPLMCNGDDNWSAKECVALGLNIDDLLDIGLYYRQQYADLMSDLTRTEAAQAEKKLQTKLEHLEQLVDAEETVAAQAATVSSISSLTPNHHYQHEEAPIDEPEVVPMTRAKPKKSNASPPPPAAAAAAQGQRVVVIEKQVPVYIREPVYVQSQLPPAAAAQDVPSLIKPYERRGAQKFSRHGALIK